MQSSFLLQIQQQLQQLQQQQRLQLAIQQQAQQLIAKQGSAAGQIVTDGNALCCPPIIRGVY
jgi:hypothetical protein